MKTTSFHTNHRTDHWRHSIAHRKFAPCRSPATLSRSPVDAIFSPHSSTITYSAHNAAFKKRGRREKKEKLKTKVEDN